MSGKLFISYRREDDPTMALLLKKSLERSGSVFLDSTSISYGTDFVVAIRKAIPKCKVFILLIGKSWQPNRLHEDGDPVRLEIRAALESKVAILPVRYDGAPMPRNGDLPRDIRPFLNWHAAEIRKNTMEADLQDVVDRIVEILRNRHLSWYSRFWEWLCSPDLLLSLAPLLQVLLSCVVLGPLGFAEPALLLTGAALPSLAATMILSEREPLAASMFLFGGMVLTAAFSLMILGGSTSAFLSGFVAFLGFPCSAASGYLSLLRLRASKASRA